MAPPDTLRLDSAHHRKEACDHLVEEKTGDWCCFQVGLTEGEKDLPLFSAIAAWRGTKFKFFLEVLETRRTIQAGLKVLKDPPPPPTSLLPFLHCVGMDILLSLEL